MSSTIPSPYYLYEITYTSPSSMTDWGPPERKASVKFRSERDALVEMLATAGRAVGGRGGSSPVLSGLLLDVHGQLAVRRPGPTST